MGETVQEQFRSDTCRDGGEGGQFEFSSSSSSSHFFREGGGVRFRLGQRHVKIEDGEASSCSVQVWGAFFFFFFKKGGGVRRRCVRTHVQVERGKPVSRHFGDMSRWREKTS